MPDLSAVSEATLDAWWWLADVPAERSPWPCETDRILRRLREAVEAERRRRSAGKERPW